MADTEEGAPAAEQAAEGEEGQQAAAGAPPAKDPASDFRRAFNYPLVKYSDMHEEMQTEVTEMCVTAAEKHAGNNENAAKMIKEAMDKKFGMAWHVVVGEGYAFEISHESKNVLHMYFGGQISTLVWKCS